MSDAPRPYRPERYEIGTARDGRRVALLPMSAQTADILGRATVAFGPWAHYGLDGAVMSETFKNPTVSAYQIDCDGALAGAVVIRPSWLVGPYLQMLAVLPPYQGQGIGARILAWYEAEAAPNVRNLWLCVSGYNVNAQRLYLAHGFERVVIIDGLLRDGDDELLMRKRLAR